MGIYNRNVSTPFALTFHVDSYLQHTYTPLHDVISLANAIPQTPSYGQNKPLDAADK
jgi:hypothetical protein